MNTQVIVFVMAGCGHCEEYRPRFRYVATQYAGYGVPVYVLDANDPRFSPLADRLGVRATPATFVLRRPYGVLKVEGAVDDATIHRLLQAAVAYR